MNCSHPSFYCNRPSRGIEGDAVILTLDAQFLRGKKTNKDGGAVALNGSDVGF